MITQILKHKILNNRLFSNLINSNDTKTQIKLLWKIIIRFFRAIGIEVFWNIITDSLSLSYQSELSFWLNLIEKISDSKLISSISSPSSPSSSSLDIDITNIKCQVDMDGCDCDNDLTSIDNLPIHLEHLLDERRGFYHQSIIFRYLSSSLINYQPIDGKIIFPMIYSEIKLNKVLTINEKCIAKNHFPNFFELNYSNKTSIKLTKITIPLPSLSLSYSSSSSSLKSYPSKLRGVVSHYSHDFDSNKFIEFIEKLDQDKNLQFNLKEAIFQSYKLKSPEPIKNR